MTYPWTRSTLTSAKGVAAQSLWDDIGQHMTKKETLAYPTQKPEALLERIMEAITLKVIL